LIRNGAAREDIMHFTEYRYLVRSDLYRHNGNSRLASFLLSLLFNPGFKYAFWMRTAAYCCDHPLLRYAVLPLAKFMLWRCRYKYGIEIPYRTRIGSGFYIGHFGGIVVNHEAVIGRNCNISQGVTIGQMNRGSRKGCPVIGDNVYIGPGAKIIGKVRIGNHVAIGANCVVSRDVPDKAVVVGVPGRVISDKGSRDYVNWTEYDDLSAHEAESLPKDVELKRS
jgi:serine O-acetyltransferase